MAADSSLDYLQYANMTPDQRRQAMFAQSLMQQGAQTGPTASPWAAASRALAGTVGGWLGGQARQDAAPVVGSPGPGNPQPWGHLDPSSPYYVAPAQPFGPPAAATPPPPVARPAAPPVTFVPPMAPSGAAPPPANWPPSPNAPAGLPPSGQPFGAPTGPPAAAVPVTGGPPMISGTGAGPGQGGASYLLPQMGGPGYGAFNNITNAPGYAQSFPQQFGQPTTVSPAYLAMLRQMLRGAAPQGNYTTGS